MNLTDKEIIKALKCCGNSISEGNKCAKCPMCDEPYGCSKVLCSQAVDLINRLQDLNKALINGQETLQKTIVEQKAEIERLEEMLDSAVSSERNVVDNIGYEKAEGIKEFAERVKQEINFPLAVWKVFDNLVKELTESVNYGSSKT